MFLEFSLGVSAWGNGVGVGRYITVRDCVCKLTFLGAGGMWSIR